MLCYLPQPCIGLRVFPVQFDRPLECIVRGIILSLGNELLTALRLHPRAAHGTPIIEGRRR